MPPQHSTERPRTQHPPASTAVSCCGNAWPLDLCGCKKRFDLASVIHPLHSSWSAPHFLHSGTQANVVPHLRHCCAQGREKRQKVGARSHDHTFGWCTEGAQGKEPFLHITFLMLAIPRGVWKIVSNPSAYATNPQKH